MDVRSGIQYKELVDRSYGVSFNNDGSTFSVATDAGFKVYSSDTCAQQLSQDIEGGTRHTRILADTQVISYTSPTAPSTLHLYDTVEKSVTGTIALPASQTVLNSFLTLTHIAIVTPTTVHLYAHSEAGITKLAAYETAPNPHGVAVLGKTLAAFPGRSEGQVQLVHFAPAPSASARAGTKGKLHISIFAAHTTPIRALCLSPQEDAVASASTTGTLIRLHATATTYRLLELRRSITAAAICGLSISPTGAFLAATSSTQTLHIFALPAAQSGGAEESSAAVERGWTAVEATPAPPAAGTAGASTYSGFQKWGAFARLPFAPRVLRDVYSVASCAFDPGERDGAGGGAGGGMDARKGVLAWVADELVVVLSAGRDARYERFRLSWNEMGAAGVKRVGWARFMRPN